MRMKKLMMTLAVAAFAGNTVACSLQFNTLLGVQPGSEMTIQVLSNPPDVLPLEGGTSFDIDISISILDLLFGNGINGDITIGELLIASPAFLLLGVINTGIVCVVPDAVDPGSGTFNADLGAGTATFDVNVNSVALLGNPVLAATLPGGGFPFPFAFSSSVPFGLGEILGLLFGAGGDLAVSQTLDEELVVDIGGTMLPLSIGGQIDLASEDAFPSSPLLDDCIALVSGP